MTAQQQITIRVPSEVVARLDAITDALKTKGFPASRADALRMVVTKGLEPTEHELGIRPVKKKA